MAARKPKSGKAVGTGNEGPAVPADSGETRPLISDLAIRSGKLLITGGLAGRLFGSKGKPLSRGRGLVESAILRVATRSVPGAIIVGGGFLAKTLHDRRKAREAREQAACDAADGDDDIQEA